MNGSIVLLLAVYSIQSAPISAKTQKLDHKIAAGNIKADISSGTNRVSVNGSHDPNQKSLKKRQYNYDYNQDYDQQTGYNDDYLSGQNKYDTGYYDQSGNYDGGNQVDDSEYWNNLKSQQEEEGWYGNPMHKNDDNYNNGVCEPGNCGADIPRDYFEKYIQPTMNK